jgi:hypothetical protein
MPGFDGTGPAGMGPMTGGARGWCYADRPRIASYGPYRRPYPAQARPNVAFGYGRPGWGMGRGFRGRGRGIVWGRGRGRGWWR